MRKILTGLAAISLSFTVEAATEIQEKQMALDVVKRYADVASCMHSFVKDPEGGKTTTINDVHMVERDLESNIFVYYVLWSGDIGCAGGSGTMSRLVTEVARYGGSWKPLTIQTDYAFGEDVGINYKYIQSIRKINPYKFEVISWDYADDKYGGEDGGSNFPANKFKYTIEREKYEKWRITNQSLLEQNK